MKGIKPPPVMTISQSSARMAVQPNNKNNTINEIPRSLTCPSPRIAEMIPQTSSRVDIPTKRNPTTCDLMPSSGEPKKFGTHKIRKLKTKRTIANSPCSVGGCSRFKCAYLLPSINFGSVSSLDSSLLIFGVLRVCNYSIARACAWLFCFAVSSGITAEPSASFCASF